MRSAVRVRISAQSRAGAAVILFVEERARLLKRLADAAGSRNAGLALCCDIACGGLQRGAGCMTLSNGRVSEIRAFPDLAAALLGTVPGQDALQ